MTDKINAYADFIGKQVKQEEIGVSATKIFTGNRQAQQSPVNKEEKVNAYADFISNQTKQLSEK
jgi:hypothetical protein